MIASHRTVYLSLLLSAGLALPAAAAEPALPSGHADVTGKSWALLDEFCSECHNTVDWAGSVAFDTLSPETVPDNAKVWESTVRKMQGRLMPPPGKPQPTQANIDQLVGWLQTTLDSAGEKAPRPGYVGVQRLNRNEYANSVRELLGVEVKGKDLLPPESRVDGFEDVAAGLSVSPYFIDQYIGAARTVARIAIGDRAPKVTNAFYPAPGGDQDSYVPGLPLGTRGGMVFKHNFPADGDYRFNVNDLDIGLYPWAAETRHTLVLLIDGKEIFRQSAGGPEDLATVDREGADGRRKVMARFQNIPARISAGTHEITVTFIERSRAESDEAVGGSSGFGAGGRLRTPRLLDGVQIIGPAGAVSLSRNESRAKIFICEPKAAAEERACAERIASSLAQRAFRRPADAADVKRLMPFYEMGRRHDGSFDEGIKQVVTAVLASPDFLYRAVLPPQGGQAGRPLSDLELATRLSFFLWSQNPDEELQRLAVSGRLHEPAVLAQQVHRLLTDPRAIAVVKGFALRWLNLDELEQIEPDPKLFPSFTPALREDFSQELQLFVKSVLLGDQSVVNLISSNQTFLDERLARHYGINTVFGPQFRQVTLTDPHRFGLMGKGAVLLRTSYGDRTSPILRGAWVLDKLMGTPPAPPPPGVNTDISTPEGQKPKTLRARLEKHRANQSCNQCHGVIDPIGLALDNFDAIGRWRDFDTVAQENIDPATTLASGVKIKGVDELRAQLLARPELFVLSLTRKLMIYAIGRELDPQDMPQLRGIIRGAQAEDYRFSALVTGIVNSSAFRMQALPQAAPPVQTQVAAAKP